MLIANTDGTRIGATEPPLSRSPGTFARILLFAASVACGALLFAAGFPPGSSDRLPLLALAVALALFTAARPARGLVLFAFVFPWCGLLARLCGGADPFAWPEILLAGLAAGWTFRFIYDFESEPEPTRADRPLRALFVVWTLSLLLAEARALTLWAVVRRLFGRVVNGEGLSASVAVRESLFAYTALAGGVVFYFLLRRSGAAVRRRAAKTSLAGVTISAGVALLQGAEVFPSEARAFWRLTGRFGGGAADPNSLGLLCALLVPVVLAGALRKERPKALWPVVLVIFGAGIVLSGSRSGAAVALASVLLFLFTRAISAKARRAAFAVALVLLAAAAFVAYRGGLGPVGARFRQTFDPSLPVEYRVSARPVLWRAAGRLFLEDPIVGAGMGAFAWRLPDLLREDGRALPARDNPGSGYVQALAETGLVGFLLTIAAVGALGRQSWRHARKGDGEDLTAAGGTSVVAFLAALLAGSHWLAPDVSLLFFLLAAASAPATRRAPSRSWRLASGSLLAIYAAAAGVAILSTLSPRETFRYAPRIGFHDAEMRPGGSFRWTGRRFAVWIRPAESMRLGLANFSPEGRPVSLLARSGGRELYRATFAPGQARGVRILGATKAASVVFLLDRGFVPRRLGVSADRRTLGLLSTGSDDGRRP